VTTWVALLRGINVGGARRIAMPELRATLESLGLEDVATYVQSGNVVFRRAGSRAAIRRAVEDRIEEVFGLDVATMLRSKTDLDRITARNPWPERVADPTRVHVVFLDRKPTAAAVAELDPDRSPPDEFLVDGSEIFVSYPNGSGRSKLTLDYFERRLDVRATARNWKTVTKLLALMR
jgi:uncharacterized protein (DUF1697 family)